MSAYILRRLLLIIPTLLGIMTINFLIVQAAPGGPVEQALAKVKGGAVDATVRITGSGDAGISTSSDSGSDRYRGAKGLDPDLVDKIEKLYGFDKPAHERYVKMLIDYTKFDFGDSFSRDANVLELIREKLPVSISLGLWSTLLIYLISIPLGIKKAVRDGSSFDLWSSTAVVIGYAIPGFLFSVLLIVLFAGGSFLDWFPLRGLQSEGAESFPLWQRIVDYFWHLALPVLAMVVGGFAGLTMLTKNSFIEEINKQYVLTARAKGLTENRVLYGHVFRNAMLIVVAGFPSAFISILFTSSLLIEIIFSLDGLGLLGFEAAINRDYPVMFGTLYIFTLLGLVLNLAGDLMYTVIDPRIDFEGRQF